MKVISDVIAILAFLAGLILAGLAFSEISVAFSPLASSASAIQLTQVYTQGLFYGMMSASSFLLTIAVLIGNAISAIGKNTEAIQFYGNKQ